VAWIAARLDRARGICRARSFPRLFAIVGWSKLQSAGQHRVIRDDRIRETSNCFVGVFFLRASARNPLRATGRERETAMRLRQRLLQGVPNELRELSEEASQYVVDDVAGETMPIITSAFWSDIHADASPLAGPGRMS
jgi:hypothetical protein